MTKETPIRRSTRLASKSIQKTPPSIALPKSKRKTTKKEAPLTQVRPCRIELWKSSAEEDDLFTVRRKLNAYFVPSELPCREKEFEKVYDLVSSSLQSGNSRVLYISGVPGTGKTSTVLQVKRKLEKEKHGRFLFIEVNGMRLAEPALAFSQIYYKLMESNKENQRKNSKKKISANLARRKLNQIFEFADRDRLPIVLVVDELDLLLTKRQDVLYDIFNWTQMDGSRVVVLAIANTLDLPERILNQRVKSRMGMDRLAFAPYTHEQIESILEHRLGCVHSKVVDSKTIQLISRKVAAVNGDLRKAMDLLRSSIDVALREGHSKVVFDHAFEVFKERRGTSEGALLRSLNDQSTWILRVCIGLYLTNGHDEITLSQLLHAYRRQSVLERGLRPVTATSAFESCVHLAASRLIVFTSNQGLWTRKFRLGVSPQEAKLILEGHYDDK